MASGKEVTAARGTRPTGHGVPIREHRGREGVHATSARPRTGPEDAVGAGTAMAGGVKHVSARRLGSMGHETRK